MTVANAPAGKAHLDIIHICFVIAITVRYKKQVGWSANENAIKANCQSGGKGAPFHKYFFRIRFTVIVGVFQDQNRAVSRTRQAVWPGFVVPVSTEETTSELKSLMRSYHAAVCLKHKSETSKISFYITHR